MVDGHEREGRIDLRVDHRDIQPVGRIDRLPVMHGSAAQRVDRQLEAGGANGVHVDDVAQIVDIGTEQIFLMGRACAYGGGEAHPPDARIAVAQQFVGTGRNPLRDVHVGRAAIGRIVLEPTVLWWVVRRRDDDAVGEAVGAAVIVHQDRPRDDRSWRHAVVALNDGLDVVGCQDLQRRALSRPGNGMCVLAHEERTAGAVRLPVVADRLGDGEDVGFGERPMQRRAAMATGAEPDQLVRIREIGPATEIFAFKLREIDQQFLRRRLSRERRDWHGRNSSSGAGKSCNIGHDLMAMAYIDDRAPTVAIG